MRILHVHCRYREAGGEDAAVDAERRLLRAAGFEVIAHDAVNPDAPLATAGKLLMSSWNPAAYLEVGRLARTSAPDVAHVHNTWFGLSPSVLEALHRAGVPTVATIHNYRLGCINGLLFRDGRPCTDCIGRGPWQGVLHRCYRSSAGTSAIAATSVALNRRLATWRRCVARFLVLNPMARDVLVASGIPTSAISMTANFTQDPGPREHPPSRSDTLLYVGRLSHEKGVDVLLRAWRAWRPDEPWTLAVVGDGPDRSALERAADARVHFFGRLPADRVASLMAQSRTLVLPSVVYENQPMVAIEAFAAGLPVLGSALGGTLHVLRPLGRDWTVGEATAAEWTRALDRLVDPAAVDAAGHRARAAFERTHSPRAALLRARDLYGQVMAQSRPLATA